jgi:hypothetical protein
VASILAAVRAHVALLALLVLLVAAGATAVSEAARASRAQIASISCDPSGARTLAVDADARVYSLRKKVYGCANGATRRYVLGSTGFCVNADAVGAVVRLAAAYVGYSVATCGIDNGTTIVYLRRLSDGAITRQHGATTTVGVESHQTVNSLVVRADGAVAWIATANSIGAPKLVRQVERLDSHGFALLDSGRGIAPNSLDLHGTLISWTDHGTVHDAKLR